MNGNNKAARIRLADFSSAIGASSVITQFHTSMMFARTVVATANAAAAGWGQPRRRHASAFPRREPHHIAGPGLLNRTSFQGVWIESPASSSPACPHIPERIPPASSPIPSPAQNVPRHAR
jgi:hypothetical protein